jgi:hypothetical protein
VREHGVAAAVHDERCFVGSLEIDIPHQRQPVLRIRERHERPCQTLMLEGRERDTRRQQVVVGRHLLVAVARHVQPVMDHLLAFA